MANDIQDNSVREYEREEVPQLNQAYMNRLFCSTKERIGYILFTVFSGMGLGKYDFGGDIWKYKIFGIQPEAEANALIGLSIYDMINDPLTAAIVDNMRTRWGKFKPFQYLALLPSIAIGLFGIFMPVIADSMGFGDDPAKKLIMYMVYLYANETIGAFFGGGGYITNVFTPNPNERTSLLVSARFVGMLCEKLPSQIVGIFYDLLENEKIKGSFRSIFLPSKTIVWLMAMIPTIYWYFVSKERVPQSETPPNPVKGILAVFKNKPLLIRTLSSLIDGINIGSGEDLYYNDVLKFNMLPTIAGIPGSPVSYASYAFVPKFRKRFSTKTLWFLDSGSIIFSEGFFFLVGLIGGKKNGFYRKKIPMTIAFAIGNMVEMTFYATKKIIGDEINYEVLDYCEWKNGYRVEATITLITGYFNKIKDIFLRVINAKLLQTWAGYKIGEEAVQTDETMWRLFIIAFGPHLIFDLLSLVPMIFYNIDKDTREKMYLDLEISRAKEAARVKNEADNK